jgi:hypothetical protein
MNMKKVFCFLVLYVFISIGTKSNEAKAGIFGKFGKLEIGHDGTLGGYRWCCVYSFSSDCLRSSYPC